MKLDLTSIVLVLCLCSLSTAQVLNKQAVSDTLELITASSNGNSRPQDAYYAAAAAAALGQPSAAHGGCEAAAAAFTQPGMQLTQAFYGIKLAALSRCPELKQWAQPAEATAQAALQSGTSVGEFYEAIGILATLHAHKVLSKDLKTQQMEGLDRVLQKLVLPSGLVRERAGSPGSVQAAGQLYLALADARDELHIKLAPDSESAADDLISAIPQVLATASTNGLSAAGDSDPLAAASIFLRGAAAVKAPGLDNVKLSQLGAWLAAQQPVGGVEDAYHVATGLRALPADVLVITPPAGTLSLAAPEPLKAKVTDVWGTPAASGAAALQLASLKLGGQSVLSNVAASWSAGEFSFDLQGASKAPGVADVVLEATSKGKPVSEARFQLPITDALVVSDAELTLVGPDDQEGDPLPLEYPSSMRRPVGVEQAASLQVSFKVAGESSGQAWAVQQAALRLTTQDSPRAFWTPAKASGARWTATASLPAVERHLGQAASFEATLLVRDPAAAEPIVWLLGSFTTGHLPAPLPEAPSLDRALTKPQILHMHRAPSARPPAAVSYLFTGLAVAPLGVLVVLLGSVGINFEGLPSGGKLVTAVGFHAGIAAILLLYLVFWIRLTLLTMLPMLAGLLLYTTVLGYHALRAPSVAIKAHSS